MSWKSGAPSNQHIDTVNIRPGVSILSVLRHLNYKPWFALAEFVDNAVQSYSERKDDLNLYSPGFKFHVKINIDSTPPARISIRDNAAGIAYSEFPRAFRPAAIPENRSGLSEFGMGMKSAACWFAPRWSVRTTAVGEPVERTVRFDVNQIVHDEIEELQIRELLIDPVTHFTEVVLEDLNHVPRGRAISKIKEHLTDIYRVFIREGVLDLYYNNELLTYEEPSILHASFSGSPSKPSEWWRKDIDFDFGIGLSAKGFAALMNPGSFSKSGFALFRRGRLIQGSADEGYRPRAIFRNMNSFRSLRLFGELHLEGFEVSHTKDGFRWDENEEAFLQILEDHLNSSELPILTQADNFRVRAAREEVKKAAEEAVDNTMATMRRNLVDVLRRVAEKPSVETQEELLPDVHELVSRELPIRFHDQDWLVRVELTNDPAEGQWLSVSNSSGASQQSELIEIRLSMAHPFMVRFAQTDTEDIEALLRVAAGLALSEKLARRAGHRYTGTIRRNLNDIMREALSKP